MKLLHTYRNYLRSSLHLRNEGDIRQPFARTSSFQKSFIPSTTTDWNALSTELKSCVTPEAFSYNLNKAKTTVPKWYFVGKRTLNVLHARLRMLCSPLNDHLFSHIHVIDNPACPCGHERENNRHFFLECPLYNEARRQLYRALDEIEFEPLLSNILQGNVDYSIDKNCKAFNIVQDYIKRTGRFD